jgi:hypothetical protein
VRFILNLPITLGILFTVSPHKNIKKAINHNVLAENVLGANGEIGNKFSWTKPRFYGISIKHFAEHRIDRKAPKQQCYLGAFLFMGFSGWADKCYALFFSLSSIIFSTKSLNVFTSAVRSLCLSGSKMFIVFQNPSFLLFVSILSIGFVPVNVTELGCFFRTG